MLEDAAHGGNQQVFLGVRHRHLAGLAGVFELVMGTNHMNQIPAISFESLDEVGAFHFAMIHTTTQQQKLTPPPGPPPCKVLFGRCLFPVWTTCLPTPQGRGQPYGFAR